MLRPMPRPLYVESSPADPFDTARTKERPSVSQRAAVRIIRTGERGPQPLPLVRPIIKANGTEEIDVCEVLEEIDLHPDQRGPLVSVNATQELSVEDVLDVRNAPIVDDEVDAFVDRHDYASVPPFAIDTSEVHYDRQRLTILSTEEISRRQRRGGLIVGAAVGFGLAVMAIAGVTQLVPMAGSHRLEPVTPLLSRAHSNDLGWSHSHRIAKGVALQAAPSGKPELVISVDDLPKSKRR